VPGQESELLRGPGIPYVSEYLPLAGVLRPDIDVPAVFLNALWPPVETARSHLATAVIKRTIRFAGDVDIDCTGRAGRAYWNPFILRLG